MSMRSPACYAVPDETVRVARAAFPKGNVRVSRHRNGYTELD